MGIKQTIEYQVEEFKRFVQERCFNSEDVKIDFVIRQVGGTTWDIFSGENKVVSVNVTKKNKEK